MCYYRSFVFLGCGHKIHSLHPIEKCTDCATAAAKAREKIEGMSRVSEGRTVKMSGPGLAFEQEEFEQEMQGRVGVKTIAVKQLGNRNVALDVGGMECEGVGEASRASTAKSKYQYGGNGIPEATASASKNSDPNATVTPSDKPCHRDDDNASVSTSSTDDESTYRNIQVHPYQTIRVDRSCLFCTRSREALLAQSESTAPQVRFEDWRWKVKYLSPVPEEARYSSDWGLGIGVGEVMGSWVKDIGGKAKEGFEVLREQVVSLQPAPVASPLKSYEGGSRSRFGRNNAMHLSGEAGGAADGKGKGKGKEKGKGKGKKTTIGKEKGHTKNDSGNADVSMHPDVDKWRAEVRAKSKELGEMGFRGGLPSS